MTEHFERRREAHRGFMIAKTKVEAAVDLLDRAGLSFSFEDDDRISVIIEGRVRFSLATSYWREIDGGTAGFSLPGLIQHFSSTSSAAGRDSNAEIGVSPLTDDSQAPALAESAAGPIAPEASTTTASLLPAVWP